MPKIRGKNAVWRFAIHQDPAVGPNRVTYNPSDALRFYRKVCNKGWQDAMVEARHIPSGMKTQVLSPEDLSYFVNNLVEKTGVRR